MVAINFVSHDGVTTAHDLPPGESLMRGAVNLGVAGIDADCGGQLACGTCLVAIGTHWQALLPQPQRDELEMLEAATEGGSDFRLSCQITIGPELEGMVVNVPQTQ